MAGVARAFRLASFTEFPMTASAEEAAAQFLFAARTSRAPGDRIPEAFRPTTIDAALAIQRRVGALTGMTVGGWKCSVPSAARPVLAAPIDAKTIRRESPAPLPATAGVGKIEPEIAFMLAGDLAPRERPYSEDEVKAAIGSVHLVIELIGARYADPAAVSFPELLADNVANSGLLIGPAIADAFTRTLERFPLEVRGPGGPLLTHDGKHPDGHPLLPLYWLANYLAARGDFLRAGQIVTTGSYAGIVEVPLDTVLTLTYGDLGSFDATFVASPSAESASVGASVGVR